MLNILIYDDDPVFARDFARQIAALPDYAPKTMTLHCLTEEQALCDETFADCDLLFLDIDLGEKNGIDLARRLRQKNTGTVLIFVTNFKEYAPEGYEVDAFRYLDKSEVSQKLAGYFSDAVAMCRKRQRKVEILCQGEPVSLPVQHLVYAESQGHEQCLYLADGPRRQLFTRMTMSQLESLLGPQGFLRIHKSFLVNMAYLQSLQSTGALLSTGQSLPVGARSYRENKQEFVKWQAHQIW